MVLEWYYNGITILLLFSLKSRQSSLPIKGAICYAV